MDATPGSLINFSLTVYPAWATLMATKQRKTLVVCTACHDVIHAHPVTNAA
jgi:AI2M/AI1M-like HNH endonuclease